VDSIALLTGALGQIMARLPPHELAYAWLATTHALMAELKLPLPTPPPWDWPEAAD
jgi:hypothetical protein